tara:strand:- start:413 stop:949 length:537 start_codon:yes stop_codon:yes gene_type:complete
MIEEEEEKQCVYFFRHVGLNPVKIGYSSNSTPLSRFDTFRTYAPFGAELLGFIETKEAKILESDLHKKYSDKRLKGEWFNISAEEVECLIVHYSTETILIEKSNFQIAYAKSLEPVEFCENFNPDIMLDNENIHETLKRLLSSGDIYSKTKLAKEVGVSRNTIYKYIKKIKDEEIKQK